MAGPLWATSAFTFESTNYHLKQQVSGPKGVDNQICKRYLRKNLLKWQADNIHKNSEDNITNTYLQNVYILLRLKMSAKQFCLVKVEQPIMVSCMNGAFIKAICITLLVINQEKKQ